MNRKELLLTFKNNFIKEKAKKESIESAIKNYKLQIKILEDNVAETEKISNILSSVALQSKQSIVKFLEDIVTDALRYISETDYSFKIEIDDAGKTYKCNFYLVEEVDGVISKQKPEDACGGGFIDIISTTLRYAYLSLYNSPKLMGSIILDEPGKMVSQDMSIRFAEFIKKLGEDFNRQTIMITHNENLKIIGDNEILITKSRG